MESCPAKIFEGAKLLIGLAQGGDHYLLFLPASRKFLILLFLLASSKKMADSTFFGCRMVANRVFR